MLEVLPLRYPGKGVSHFGKEVLFDWWLSLVHSHRCDNRESRVTPSDFINGTNRLGGGSKGTSWRSLSGKILLLLRRKKSLITHCLFGILAWRIEAHLIIFLFFFFSALFHRINRGFSIDTDEPFLHLAVLLGCLRHEIPPTTPSEAHQKVMRKVDKIFSMD